MTFFRNISTQTSEQRELISGNRFSIDVITAARASIVEAIIDNTANAKSLLMSIEIDVSVISHLYLFEGATYNGSPSGAPLLPIQDNRDPIATGSPALTSDVVVLFGPTITDDGVQLRNRLITQKHFAFANKLLLSAGQVYLVRLTYTGTVDSGLSFCWSEETPLM